MRIDQRLIPIVGLGVLGPLMQPALFGQILNEGKSLPPHMIIDGILDQLHSPPMQGV